MAEYKEVSQVPAACEGCQEQDCYACDIAGERWRLSEKDALMLEKKGLEKAIERYQMKIAQIDIKLAKLK